MIYRKNYYEILGVSRDATVEEIRRRFRELAKDNHPDTEGGGPINDRGVPRSTLL